MPAEIRITARVLAKGGGAFGPGPARLLEHIAAEGSISKAAKAMDMSYSRAWQLVDRVNNAFRKPLVESAAGGKRGGGATLTRQGEEVLNLFRKMESRLNADAAVFHEEFEKRLR
jgi:molybdate transport system regulatory protein